MLLIFATAFSQSRQCSCFLLEQLFHVSPSKGKKATALGLYKYLHKVNSRGCARSSLIALKNHNKEKVFFQELYAITYGVWSNGLNVQGWLSTEGMDLAH